MKILFLEIDTETSWFLSSIGPAAIGSYIRSRGHQAAFFRLAIKDSPQDALLEIERQKPDLIGFSLTTRQWPRAQEFAFAISKSHNIPIIAGGPHPSFSPESILQSESFDYVCIGEGEEPVAELLDDFAENQGRNKKEIANIWKKGAAKPTMRPPITSLDRLPFLARDLLEEQNGVAHVLTQRGCPFRCTYCAAGSMSNIYKTNQYLRRRSAENVLEELQQIKESSPLSYVVFLDDTFTINKKWLKKFCNLYEKEIGTGFSINGRADTVTAQIIEDLQRAGCKHIIYGVESGSERIRREVLNRSFANEDFINAFEWTKEAGMMATANYMIGLPGETAEDIEQTLALNQQLEPDDFAHFVFYPYPGTPLFDLCIDKKYLAEDGAAYPTKDDESTLDMPDLSKQTITDYYGRFVQERIKTYKLRYGPDFSF